MSEIKVCVCDAVCAGFDLFALALVVLHCGQVSEVALHSLDALLLLSALLCLLLALLLQADDVLVPAANLHTRNVKYGITVTFYK